MRRALLILSFLGFWSCSEDQTTDEPVGDDFDRQAMLTHWADQVIIPRLQSYQNASASMVQAAQRFEQDPTNNHYVQCKSSFRAAYLAWQGLGIFNLGAAESSALLNRSNLYPCDTATLALQVSAGGAANYALPSTFDEQGWPAIDWLLHGSDSTQALGTLQQDSLRRALLTKLAVMTDSLAEAVRQDWQSRFRDAFIDNDGSSATASVNKLVNDYIFYFERMVRSGKVGIPAGVFSVNPLPQNVEAPYAPALNKALLLEALQNCRYFYLGQDFTGANQGLSLYQYLVHLNKQDLADKIDDHFLTAIAEAEKLPTNLSLAVQNDNQQMLRTFDAMQKTVILIKVDMMQALNIRIDYVDADGD